MRDDVVWCEERTIGSVDSTKKCKELQTSIAEVSSWETFQDFKYFVYEETNLI